MMTRILSYAEWQRLTAECHAAEDAPAPVEDTSDENPFYPA